MPRRRRGTSSGLGLLAGLLVLLGAVGGPAGASAAAARPAVASAAAAGPAAAATAGACAKAAAGTGSRSAAPQRLAERAEPRDVAATSGHSPAAAAPVVLPRDEAPHSDPAEWWYFSGHLWGVDPAGHLHCYGYEYVTFQFLGIAPAPVYFGNLGVTDLTRGTFRYAAKQDMYPVPDTRGSFAVHTGSWSMRGRAGHDVLHAALPGYRLDLTLQTTKPAALHGSAGVIPYGPFGSSKYYSWTSLLTGGTLVDHGVRVKVLGTSWMDHQWGAINFASGGGWDWFSLQLSNGEQYMLYFVRDRSGAVVTSNATRVGVGGRVSHPARRDFSQRALGTWRSPVTGITYSSGWRLSVPRGTLTVTPDLLDQELDLRQIQGVAYWEGSVSVRGTIDGAAVTGVGYTEINPANAP